MGLREGKLGLRLAGLQQGTHIAQAQASPPAPWRKPR